MNDDISINLRREKGRWFWTLTRNGEQHEGPRPEAMAEHAAGEADQFRRQLELGEHFRKMRLADALYPLGCRQSLRL